MKTIPFINVHTHSGLPEKGVVSVGNIFPDEEFPTFSGLNFYSVGLHPWHIKTLEENNRLLDLVKNAMKLKQVLWVGECGLDKVCKTDFVLQKQVFIAQAAIAEACRKPLIIHCIRAFNEIMEINNQLQPEIPWILHGYNGNIETTRQLEKKHFFFSFGKSLFDVNSKSIESFRYLPLNRIFFETDEYKGSVKEIYETGAKIRNIDIDTLILAVSNNFALVQNSIQKRD